MRIPKAAKHIQAAVRLQASKELQKKLKKG
jgi:hypothetical protein